MTSDFMSEALEGFRKNLAIVEGTSVPGSRSFDESQTLGIVPLGVVMAPSKATQTLELNLPDILDDLDEAQLNAFIEAARDAGATPDQFFQIAEELGEVGIFELLGEERLEEVIGAALAGIGAYKLAKGYLKHRAKSAEGGKERQKLKTSRLKHKTDTETEKQATLKQKGEHEAAKAKTKAAKKGLVKSRQARGDAGHFFDVKRSPAVKAGGKLAKGAGRLGAKAGKATGKGLGKAGKAAGKGIGKAASAVSAKTGSLVKGISSKLKSAAAERSARRAKTVTKAHSNVKPNMKSLSTAKSGGTSVTAKTMKRRAGK